MPISKSIYSVKDHFEKRAPEVRAVYDAVLKAARRLGEVLEEPKKTSIHLVRRTAFAGVMPRKKGLILTLKSVTDVKSPRLFRRERVSKNRWHLAVRLHAPHQVDAELKAWMKASYKSAK